MTCPRCGADNGAAARFCEDCGARLEALCPSCRAPVTPGKKFCRSCGAELAGAAAPARAAEARPPRHLAEKILASRSALEGERKLVTVLFADLKGSMELLADRDPEEARKLLDPVLTLMMDAVHRQEGTVNQVMGDGIMALFGAPLAHEDHAVRACHAALRMQESIRRYAAEVRRSAGVSIAIRVGLNSGEVVVRSIGSDLRMDYTAVGQTTHLAARMEQTALPGSILLTGSTVALAEDDVAVKPLGPIPVKGLAAPVDVFELTGIAPARTRLQARASRGLSRFVGREAEMVAVGQALARAGAGHGQVIALVGEPGVGKSRLAWEVSRSPLIRDWLVLSTASVAQGTPVPYLPMIELLKAYFHVDSSEAPRIVRERVTRQSLALDGDLEPSVPALLALLDVAPDDPGWTALDPPQRRQRTVEAIRRLLLRESERQPLLLVFEDLHWIDRETQAALDGLVDGLTAARVLLLFNFRPEYEHHWPARASVTQLRITPLPTGGARALLDALLGGDPALGALKDMLTERTGGNPFFLEECVRTLREAGVLTGDPGDHRLTRPPDSVQVPPTVQAVLAARIDRLDPEDKRILQTASVVGKDVAVAVLAEVAEAEDSGLRASLERLEAAELLDEVRLFPTPEYTFTHALTHDVTYGTLLQDRRRALHGQIVTALERLYPERQAEHTERLAHHAFRGEAWDKAAAYALQAGQRAVDRSAMLEARAHFEQGVDAAERLAPSPEALATTFDLCQIACNALFALGERTRLLAAAERMLDISERLGDPRRLALAKVVLANALWFLGENRRALPIVEDAVAMAERIADPGLQIVATLDLGMIQRSRGQFRRGAEVFDRIVQSTVGPLAESRIGRNVYPFVSLRIGLAMCLAELGEMDRAVSVAEAAMAFADKMRHPASVQSACSGLGHALTLRGRYGEAVGPLARGVDVARQSGLASFLPMVTARLGLAYAGAGRVDEALPIVRGAAERVANANPRDHATVLAALAEVLCVAGQYRDARAAAERALESSRATDQQGREAWSHWLIAEVTRLEDECGSVACEPLYRETLGLAAALEMRPLMAHCHLGFGELHRGVGNVERAREHFATAATMYRAMGMHHWLPRTEGHAGA